MAWIKYGFFLLLTNRIATYVQDNSDGTRKKKILSGSNFLGFIGNLIGYKDPSTSYPHAVFLFQIDLVSVYQNSLFRIKEVQCNCESHKPGSRGKFKSCTYIIAKGQVQLKPGKQEKKEGHKRNYTPLHIKAIT